MQGQLTGDTGDIGFVGHFSGPDGYALEALQSTLNCNNPAPSSIPSSPLCAERPVLGQLKVNTKDPERALAFYRDALGMTLLSQVTISRFGLTLYFLAFTEERPPDFETAIDSPSNRAWLWQAEFTQLELQYWHDFEGNAALKLPPSEARVGFAGFTIMCSDPSRVAERLISSGAPVVSPYGVLQGTPLCRAVDAVTVLDPDGRPVRLAHNTSRSNAL
ncbi:hypothetical protein CYMTET_33992 [Cymbomonas tetramitiformis]|uniref:Lactoylglutathione lyase n=1 Tax=Cymbomonas tetramitiformis TaxID=36881 RepID=A0AAE0FC20_9CHLO|nr:hypothetical protein CYMTET_33992 [Cymbomonas tetramitiformis]